MTQEIEGPEGEMEDASSGEMAKLATPGDRLLAYIVDALIFIGIGILGLIVGIILALVVAGTDEFEKMTSDNFWGVAFLLIILPPILFVIAWEIFVLFMVARDGQSPGKKVLKVRIVSADGSEWGWRGTIVREILGKWLIIVLLSTVVGAILGAALGSETGSLASLIVSLALFIWIIADEKNQTLHDKITSTYVVKIE